MADTQTTVETERRQSTGVDPHQGVEVVDTNGTAAGYQPATNHSGYNSAPARDTTSAAAGFGHADLRHAEVIRGDTDEVAFRSTDLRDSELNSADFTNTQRSALDDNQQGTNWRTILMVIALILVIILIGSWLF